MTIKIQNQYIFKDNYAELIITSKNYQKTIILDKEDVEKVKKYQWHIVFTKNSLYVYSNKVKRLNHFIFNKENIKQVYFFNNNPLDNRKENLVEKFEISTDLKVGQKFNRLTVIGLDHLEKRKTKEGSIITLKYYKCCCSCGQEVIVNKYSLIYGKSQSCGCLQKDWVKKNKANYKHGKNKTRLHRIWTLLKNRCNDKNMPYYKNYGGRGISYCQEWEDFLPFYNWAMNNGYTDDLTIDRINNNGNYCPENCRWITKKEQARNQRRTVRATYNGITLSISEWAEKYNLSRKLVYSRYKIMGWTIEEALTTPIGQKRKKKEQGES